MREGARRWAAAILTSALMLADAGARADSQPAPPVCRQAPLRLTYGPVRTLATGVTASDVSFTSSCTGHTVTGEVISGASTAPHPGVLFVHWLGDAKTTNHTEFKPDAIALAKRGATSLLVDAMWAKDGWFDTVGKSEISDTLVTESQVVDLGVSLDVLALQPGVDAARIAYVGHDFGAMMGAMVAGDHDARPRWYVLMAGVPTLSEWYLLGKPEPDGYAKALDEDLNLSRSLERAKAKGFLFQFATHDHYIPLDRAKAFMAAAPEPKSVDWYDTDHALAVPAAFTDRQAWLVDMLFPKS